MIKHGQPPYLECSGKGDKRFSAFWAVVNGRSIEEQYHAAKVFEDGSTGLHWKLAKGRRAVNQEYCTQLYHNLWVQYIAEHPELLPVLRAASGLSDMFGQPGHCCQATSLWLIRGRRILICGAREWTNYARVLACVRKAEATQHIDVIIEGECRGADRMGRLAAGWLGLTVENGGVLPFPAQWDKYSHGGAGPIRNQQMLDEGRPTEVWAFHNDIDRSTGTADMVRRSVRAGLTTYLITETDWKLMQDEQETLF